LRRDATRESGDLYRLLVENVQDYAIFALDPDGYILSWNAGAERLKQYTADEVIGRHYSIFFPPEDIAADLPAMELEVARSAGRAEAEGWRVRKDGSRFWASVRLTPLHDATGELVGFAKVTRDLSERRSAAEEARRSEERFGLLVQSVRDYAIFMLDPGGHIATWNAGARNIKGYTAEEITGRHFSVFYTKADIDDGKPARELEIATREGVYEEEGWRVRKDGTQFWANVVITPVRGADGRLAGFAKVTRDLTDRRAASERALEDARRIASEETARTAAELRAREFRDLAEQLRSQAAELARRSGEAEAANRAKAEFLAAMSHELRTPLNAIGGYAQLMQMEISGPITAEQTEQLDRIQRSQQHLLGIINDILNFSRIEAGQVAYDIGAVPLNDVVAAVTPMVAPQAGAKQLGVKDASRSPGVIAHADRTKVEQILLNLLSNAVKFTNDGGTIELTYGLEPDRAWLIVRDSGVGIPADQLETIFAPFVQVGRSLANPKEGTGLGLAISRDLARAMHGDLTVESREGTGSAFRLTLPRPPGATGAP
jgi:PAS domain S-box-containing protein